MCWLKPREVSLFEVLYDMQYKFCDNLRVKFRSWLYIHLFELGHATLIKGENVVDYNVVFSFIFLDNSIVKLTFKAPNESKSLT